MYFYVFFVPYCSNSFLAIAYSNRINLHNNVGSARPEWRERCDTIVQPHCVMHRHNQIKPNYAKVLSSLDLSVDISLSSK